MLDGLRAEERGIPAAVICTDVFSETSYAVAAAHGIPWYPFALVPHPIAVLEAAEIDRLAREVVPRVWTLLTLPVGIPNQSE